MLKYLCCTLVLLPTAAMAQLDSITVAKVPGPIPPPPPPVSMPTVPRGMGRPHTCIEYYPAAALKAHAQGTALLAFTVTQQGTVTNITVQKSSGDADLDAASVACASQWLYKPATKDAVPVAVPWQANVVWKINLPLVPAAPFQPCTHFAAVTPDMLKSIAGRSWIAFQLMPDGSAKPTRIIAGSGNDDLDQAAARCIGARRYDVSDRKLPPEGSPESDTIDWKLELAAAKQPDTAASPPAK